MSKGIGQELGWGREEEGDDSFGMWMLRRLHKKWKLY